MKEFYKLIIFWLLFVGLYCYKPPLMNVSSIDEVPDQQKENLRIENGYAIIEMKTDGLKEYNASFLLDTNESLIFIFNVTYANDILSYLNLTLNLSENDSLAINLLYKADEISNKIVFYNKRDLIGTFPDSNFMSFELFPNGTLTNNGSIAIPKNFHALNAEIQEDDGKRRIDFKISWENKVYGEFMVPLSQFAVEAPPTTTTSTTSTTSTTTERTTTTTTTKKLVTESTKPPTTTEPVAEAKISDAMIWGIGLSIYAVLYLIVIGVAVYFYRKKKRELRARARTSYSPLATHPKKNAGNIQTTTKHPTLPPSNATQVPSSNVLKSNPPKTAKPLSAPAKQALVTKSAIPVPAKSTPMIKSAEQTKPTPLTKNVEPAPPVPVAPATNMKSTEAAKPAQRDKKVEPAPVVPSKIPPSQPTQPTTTTTGPKAALQPPPPTKNSDEKKMVEQEIGKPGENYVEFAEMNEKK